MTVESEPIQKKSRINEMLRAACVVLVGKSEGMAAGDVIAAVKDAVPPTDGELTRNQSGQVRYDTNLRFWSIDLVKAGWVRKKSGRWYLTDAGAKALESYPEPQDFGKAANDLYRAWKKADAEHKKSRQVWELTDAVVARIPAGRWVSFSDLGEVVGRGSGQLGRHMWADMPTGWHRVLRGGGFLTADEYDVDRADEQRRLLEEDGVPIDPAPSADHQLGAAELRGIFAELTGAPRAWFVRGTSVKGGSVVPVWLAEGFVSVPASRLPDLPPDPDDGAIKAAVEAGYATLGYSARETKIEELRSFVRRMRPGDIIVTTAEADLFVGEIAGEPIQVESLGLRSNLRRPADWDNADSPLDVADLPDRLSARLKVTDDVIELTDLIDDISGLRPRDVDDAGELGEEVEPLEAAHLRLLTDEESAGLYIGRAWLDELVSLLDDKKQVILYGPPGTGKTFLAQAVAEALGGQGHVTLVQFHPSYSYEDFFEGYRPTTRADGEVGLQLVPGPFRKIVDLAQANRTEPYFLIVDEINRANLAKVFGELYFLLEYRDRTIDLLYSSGSTGPAFSLPDNVFIIGTMNTADRSIALVDAAMRRRFAFLSLHPEDEQLHLVLRAWLRDRGLPQDRADLLVALNKKIEDRDFKIGPSYFMRPSVASQEGLERMWRTSIIPLLEEHHVGDRIDVRTRYSLQPLQASLVPSSSGERGPETPEVDEPSAELVPLPDEAAKEAVAEPDSES